MSAFVEDSGRCRRGVKSGRACWPPTFGARADSDRPATCCGPRTHRYRRARRASTDRVRRRADLQARSEVGRSGRPALLEPEGILVEGAGEAVCRDPNETDPFDDELGAIANTLE